MILADFELKPAPHSKFHFRIRVWSSKREMEKAARDEGAMTGNAQACFDGFHAALSTKIGNIYLHENEELFRDAVHELTHASVFYARDILGGDLTVPNDGEIATAVEERLCRTMESLTAGWFAKTVRLSKLAA